MEDGSEYRRWDELIPDALGLIFSNLSLREMLTVVPRVCKSWNRTASGPYCWQEIDIEQWSRLCKPDHLDRMVQMLITRSCGSFRKLCVCGLQSDAIFSFLADHAGSLQTLKLPGSNINDDMVKQIAGRLSTITFLDLSYCSRIGACALETIGKHCKLLVGLCRNKTPLDAAENLPEDDEAYAIASTMPKLKHLEMAYHFMSTKSVLTILSSCSKLEFINLRGCWDVKLDDKLLKEKFPTLKVLGPLVIDLNYSENDWECDCTEYTDDTEYEAWEFLADEMDYYDDESYDGMWDDEQRLEELELRFYDAGMYGWPPSP